MCAAAAGRVPPHAARCCAARVLRLTALHGGRGGAQNGDTPLHKAARHGKGDVVACLLAAGAAVEAQDNVRPDAARPRGSELQSRRAHCSCIVLLGALA